jgi:hypothetical protein
MAKRVSASLVELTHLERRCGGQSDSELQRWTGYRQTSAAFLTRCRPQACSTAEITSRYSDEITPRFLPRLNFCGPCHNFCRPEPLIGTTRETSGLVASTAFLGGPPFITLPSVPTSFSELIRFTLAQPMPAMRVRPRFSECIQTVRQAEWRAVGMRDSVESAPQTWSLQSLR